MATTKEILITLVITILIGWLMKMNHKITALEHISNSNYYAIRHLQDKCGK